MAVLTGGSIHTYDMRERADYPDFDIRFQNVRNELAQPHRHGYFQIQFGIEGASTQLIGGATRPFGPGYLSFVFPYRMHVIPHPAESAYCIINFQHEFLWPNPNIDPLDLESLPISRYPELAPFLFQEYIDFHFQPEDFARIRSWLDEMQALNRQRRFGAMSVVKGLLQQIIGLTCLRHETELLRQSMQKDGKTSQHDALQRVVAYVRENLERELSLTEAASAAHLSPNYLAHLLKKETGRTFTDMVTERRLERAKELLCTSRRQVREIARQCGFTDEAYFNRRFRQQIGITPRQYRNQQTASFKV